MDNRQLEAVVDECDMEIIMQNNLKVSKQCAKMVSTANRVLSQIYRTFAYKSRDIILPLYKSLVRPHLEYCVQARCSHLEDIELIEKVQRRATRLIVELRHLPYEVRLQIFGLTRRLIWDKLEVFKILNDFDNIDREHFFIYLRFTLSRT